MPSSPFNLLTFNSLFPKTKKRQLGASIFAVDVHPAGTRFATGGADSKVRIWALAPLLEEVASSEKENPFASSSGGSGGAANSSSSPSTPRLLATLSDHLQSVNAVRFSGAGNRLATGADDGTACVFELRGAAAVGLIPVADSASNPTASPSSAAAAAAAAAALAASRPAQAPVLPGTAFLGGSLPSLEQWKLVSPLRAHANNVTDVSWSPGDLFLATASLDNTIVVWETGGPGSSPNSIRSVATLRGHESYVKGVAFDPLGKYLASQADDASVLVWRTDDWRPAARVTSPFAGGSVSSSFSTRLSWAPDGTFLVACNAFDAGASVHMAPLVSRGGSWASAHSLVGHSGAVVASRASGKLFAPPRGRRQKQHSGGGGGDSSPPPRDPSEVGRVVALGAQDGRVSVWLTTRPTAVAVAARFFKQSVVDLAWTPDGFSLLAVSSDGTLACFQFEEEELGEALGEEEARALQRRLFGDERARNARFAETAGQLALERGGTGAAAAAGAGAPAAPAPSAADRLAARLAPANGTAGSLPAAAATAAAAAAAPLRKIQAASTAMMPPPPPVPRALVPSSAAAAGGGAVTILAPPPAPPQDLSAAGQRATKRQRHAASPSWLLPPPPLVSRVAAPVPSDDDNASSSAGFLGNLRAGGGIIEAVNALGPPTRPDAPPRATATVALSRASRGRGARRAWEDVVPGGVSQLVASRRFAAAATGGSPLDGGGALLLWSRAGRRLAPPLSLSAPIVHLATDDGGDSGEDLGGSKTGTEGPGDLQREQQRQQRGWGLLAVTADGGVHCWDVRARSLTLRTSLAPLLAVASASAAEAAEAAAAAAAPLTTAAADASAAVAPPPSSAPPVGLVSARLCRATGAPTVVLSDFSAAVFDVGLGGWARVADGVSSTAAASAAGGAATHAAPSSTLFAHSAFATSAAAPPPPPGMPSNAFGAPGELRKLQAQAAASGGPAAVLAGAARLAGGGSSERAAASAAARSAAAFDTRAHLESNVAAAAALGSGPEWREWTLAYVRYLTSDADEERLHEVFEELLGPARLPAATNKGAASAAAAAPASAPAWSPTLGGVDKRSLLRDALVEASRNRAVQRTVAEFDSLLGFAA
jgi:protein HIRA/HIR1